MGRTTTAAAASFGIALVAVAGVGWLLGFGLVASLVAGAILGAAAAALLVGASRRASSVDADVVFATSTPLTIAIPGILTARRRHLPMVFEVRDLWPELPIAIGALKGAVPIFLARRLERVAYHNSARVVALSPGMRDGVVATGYPADQVVVIPNSSDNSLFDVDPDVGRAWAGQDPWIGKRPLVVYIGTFGQINGVDYLARLAAAVKQRDPEVRFLAVGDGKMRRRLEQVARELGELNVNFRVLDPVAKQEVPAILSAATLASSLFVDLEPMWANSANKFFDALAAGVPVMINYGGWQSEILDETGVGFRAPVNDLETAADLLVARVRDEAWLESARTAARRLANERFDRDLLARELENTLLDVERAHASR